MAEPKLTSLVSSGFPRSVASTTLPNEKQPGLRAIIEKGEYRTNLGLSSYVLQAAKDSPASTIRAANIAAVFGKELLLAGAKVRYVPLAGVMHAVRLFSYDMAEAPIFDVFFKLGVGFIVIPDFSDRLSQRDFATWREALALLGQHVSRGGGLVLGVGHEWALTVEEHTASFCVTAADFPIIKI